MAGSGMGTNGSNAFFRVFRALRGSNSYLYFLGNTRVINTEISKTGSAGGDAFGGD